MEPHNIGVNRAELEETGANVLGIDFDSREAFEAVYPTFHASPMVAKSTRGFHAYYRLLPEQRIRNAVWNDRELTKLTDAIRLRQT